MGGNNVVDRSRRPAPGRAPTIRLPRFERFQLDNGLSVLAVRHDDMPEVSARLVLPFSATDDPESKAGTALMVARALTEGTEGRDAREVAEWIDFLGARFGVDVDHDSTLLNLRFLSRVTDGALDFFQEILTGPAFEPKEVARLREERLDEIARGLDEPRIVASLRFNEAVFDGHPYAVRPGGTEETVATIDEETLRRFHARYYRPSSATLVLVGDLPDQQELRGRLEGTLGRWEGAADSAGTLGEPADLDGRRLWGIQWGGPQSEIRLGSVGVERLDPDYPTVMVMNAILGGLFSSRINMNLREDKGWTYGATSRFDARKRRGPFVAATAVDARVTVDAVREILAEIEGVQNVPPTDEELKLAKNALTLSLPRLFETVGQVSGRVAHQVIYNLPDDYWETYGERLRAVDRDDVVRVAERLLSTERLAIVVVGPVAELEDQLAEVGSFERRDIHGRPAGRE